MNRSVFLVVPACVAVCLASFGWSQDTPPAAAQKPAAKDDIAALVARQNAIAEQYNAIFRSIKDAATLEVDVAAAQKAVTAAEAGDAEVVEARRAHQAAVKVFRALVEKKLTEHPEGAEAFAQLKQERDERASLLWEAALAQFQLDSPLSPISRALAEVAELVELQTQVQSASPDDRPAAQATLQKRRHEMIADREDGKTLLAKIGAARDAAEKLSQSMVLIETRLAPLRKKIESAESVELAKAQAAIDSALGKETLKELRAAHAVAIEKHNARVKALLAADPNAERLKSEYDKLGQQVRDLRKAVAKPKDQGSK